MHHLHPTRHANTAPIHPRDGGRNGSGPKFPSPDLRDQLLSSLTTPISISASDSNDGQYAAATSSTCTPGGGKWPNGSDMGSVDIFSRFEILCWDCTKEGCTFPPHQGGVDAAQAGIRKDGRINPDPNPGENVSDVARWKLAQHQKLGIWSSRPGKIYLSIPFIVSGLQAKKLRRVSTGLFFGIFPNGRPPLMHLGTACSKTSRVKHKHK